MEICKIDWLAVPKNKIWAIHCKPKPELAHNGRTQLLLPPILNVAFRSFEPRIGQPFPNEQLLRKKKIAATERTIFHWETAVGFTVQNI